MGRRGARPLKQLYGLTERIAEPEIRPVLDGSCRIRGHVDESENRLSRTNSGKLPTEKGYAFVNENSRPRTESGACNMCSAPCSSCMHLHRTGSLMESFCGNTIGRKEDDSCSFICTEGLRLYKSRASDDNQHAASEASNLLSPSSSNDSYSENAESKTTCRASVKHEASDAVDMPSKASSSAEAKNDLLKMANVTNCHLSSQSHITSDIDCKTFLSQDEEQRGSECLGDNISCITAARGTNAAVGNHIVDRDKKEVACTSASTSNLFGKRIDNMVQVKSSHGFHDHKTEEKQSNSRSSNIHDIDSSGDKRTGLNPAKVGISGKPGLAEFSLSDTIARAKVQSPSFSSQKGNTFQHNANSEVLERNSCSHIQTETLDCPIGNLNSSSGRPLAAGSVNKGKSTVLPIYEDSRARFSRSDDFSADLKHTNPWLESEIQLDAGISSDEVMKCNIKYKQIENNNTFTETSNMWVPQVQDKLNMEGEHSKSESGLYDVKVCDICGDAGIEELLAICSRCSDGAEHTYCMRTKLDKLPEGDWLCEECKTKEDTAIPKADNSESVSRTPKLAVLNGTIQNVVGTFNRKLLPKLNTKTLNQESGGVVKGLRSPEVSSARHTGSLADCSVTSKRASEASYGYTGSATPRKKTVRCHDTSSKNLDMGTVKPVTVDPFGAQTANNPPAFSRLGSDSFKIPARLQSPRLPVSRSNSFNSSNWKPSPRVKPLSETVIPKLKLGREYSSINSRKDGSSRTMIKSSSFKTRSSDLSNIDSSGRMQSLVLPRSEDLSGLKQLKESNVLSKKNYSVADYQSPLAGTGIPPPKGDAKVAKRDGGLQNTSESDGLSIRKVTHGGNNTGVKQSSSEYFGSQSSKRQNTVPRKPCQVSKDGIHANSVVNAGSCNKANAVLQHGATQVVEYVLCDDKTKDAIVHDDKTNEFSGFNSSYQVASGGNRVIFCQRCNETGHSTQICPIDKLLTSALQPVLERNITEGGIKRSNKWKDAGEAANKKIGPQKDNRLPNQLKESLSPSVDLICGTTSNVILANSSTCVGHLPCPEGSAYGREIIRSSDAGGSQTTDINMSEQAVHAVEASYVPTESDSNIIRVSDGSNIKSSMQIFSNQASMLTNSLRASVFPELEFIWHGCFNVTSTGKFPRLFDGIQAHLSNCASPEVPKVVTDLPCKLELVEVPRTNSWLSQFQGTSPKEDNIDLFFFAKDIESYEKNYSKLLENMLANDLALRGNISGVELLILPSNLLPANCQCWNGLFFLWGVFWERRKNCLESLPGSHKKLCRPISCKDPLVQDLPSPMFNNVSDPQKIDLMENQDMELSWCDKASKANSMFTSTSVDYQPILSCRVDNRTCNTVESPLVGNPSYQTAADCQLPSERSPFTLNCSPVSMNGCSTSLDSCLEPSLMSSAKMLCQGGIDAAYLKDAVTGSVGQVVEPPSHTETGQSRFRTLPSNAGSSNCTQGTNIEDRPSEEKMREEKKLGGASSEDPQGKTESNHLILEPTVDRKHADSVPMEKMSRDSSENSRSNHFMWASLVDRKHAGSFSMERMWRDSSENPRSTGGTNRWKETQKCVNIEDERENKKMELCVDGHASSCYGSEILSGRISSEVHSHIDLNVQQHGDVVNEETTTVVNTRGAKESATVVNSRGAERVFLQADLDPFSQLDNVIHISSDDEDFPQSNAPFLKLSLGCETRLGKKKELPLLFPRSPAKGDTEQEELCLLYPLERIANQGRPLCPAADVDASLSLSLGFPSARAKPILKTDELMPDAPHVNTSLLLFSGFPET